MIKKYTKFFFIISFLFLFSKINYCQFGSEGIKAGFQLHGLVPLDDFTNYRGYSGNDFSYMGRIFLRHEHSKELLGEIGVGYGRYNGKDFSEDQYETAIIPIEYRLVYNLGNSGSWNPYLYLGFGALHYNVENLPRSTSMQNPPEEVKATGWTGVLPAGAGIQYKLSSNVLFELSAGISYTLTENINYYFQTKTPYDSYINFGGGLTFIGDANDDEDNDLLLKNDEEKVGTDPLNPDSDGDGLSDGEEVTIYRTNPLNYDSDSDGLKDGDEVHKYNTDPLIADSDNDNLKDGEEILTYKTDPLNPDTDNDELNDGAEVLTHKTDALNADSDSDGLSDGDEINTHKTDPLNPDTDGGSINDGIEVARGTEPLNPDDDVIKVSVPITLDGIVFATDKAEIRPESEATLQTALKTLNTHPEIKVEIRGYTDSIGKRAYNMKLSHQRAEAVLNWLVDKGIDASRLTAKGFGPDNPVASNKTAQGRQQNRRIEFVRVK